METRKERLKEDEKRVSTVFHLRCTTAASLCRSICLQVVLTFFATVPIVRSSTQGLTTAYPDISHSPVSYASHPRLLANCAENFSGYEGSPIKGFQLQKIFIAATPGLRIPSGYDSKSPQPGQDGFSGFCSFRNFAETHQSEKVQSYPEILVTKEKMKGKMAKSSFKIFRALPEMHDCKGDSLSAFGMAQSIGLGEYLAKTYFGKLKSLDVVPQHARFAETIGEETLYQSLSALLHGLLTEKQFMSVDIAKSPDDFGMVLGLGDKPSPLHDQLHYFVQPSFEKESHLLKGTKLREFEGRKFVDLNQNVDVSAKTVISYLCHSLHPNIQSKLKNLSFEDIDDIFNVSDSHNNYLATNSLFHSYSISRTFFLKQKIKYWLSTSLLLDEQNKKAGAEKSHDDLKVVSVNELFMLSLLTALNVSVSQHLTPSSRLVIEIFTLQAANQGLKFESSSHATYVAKKDNDHVHGLSHDSIQNQHVEANLPASHFQRLSSDINSKSVSQIILKKSRLKLVLQGKAVKDFPESVHHIETIGSNPESSPRSAKSSVFEMEVPENDIPDSQSPVQYVRMLFNGQVVTSFIPECETDHMVSLGLCSFTKLENLLDLVEEEPNFARDEL